MMGDDRIVDLVTQLRAAAASQGMSWPEPKNPESRVNSAAVRAKKEKAARDKLVEPLRQTPDGNGVDLSLPKRMLRVLNPVDLGERYVVSKARVAQELAMMGFARMSDFVKLDEKGAPYVDLASAAEQQWSSIAELKCVEAKDGTKTWSIKLADKRQSLVTLAQMAGWLDDGTDVTGQTKDGASEVTESVKRDTKAHVLKKLQDLAKPAPLEGVASWDDPEPERGA
jgi:hypothetical protein